MIPEINRVAIWNPIRDEELSIRDYPSYRYMDTARVIHNSGQEGIVIYRYAKNFKKGKIKFCLLIISNENNALKMEKFLNKTARNLKSIVLPVRGVTYTSVYYKQ